MADMGIPFHVGIIMDGNGRWAKARGLFRLEGHRAGMARMLALIEHAFDAGIGELSLFALSTENLSRPKEETEGLFSLFRLYFTQHIPPLVGRGVRLHVVGNRSLLPADLVSLIEGAEERTKAGDKGLLTFAIAYGGRQDIVSACNRAVKEGREQTLESFAGKLSTGGMSAIDLLIRTGGEKRLSNFMLFEAAYAEIYFSEKMFPDFSDSDLDEALLDYRKRDRRFGTSVE